MILLNILSHRGFLSILSESERGAKSFSSFLKKLISSSVLINISNNQQRHDHGKFCVVSVFQDNKAERLRAMKTFEGIISIGNLNLID